MTLLVIKVLVTAMVATIIGGKIGLPLLRKMHAQQSIREDGPQSHQSKAGTPTMGGLFMLVALTLTCVAYGFHDAAMWLLLLLTLGHAGLGFFDDFIKAVKHRNLGLTAKQKLLGQFLLAGLFCYMATAVGAMTDTVLWIPVWNQAIPLGWFYYIFVTIVIVGTSNAVNLTDGLDGLAAGTSAIAAAAYAVLGLVMGMPSVMIFGTAMCGACLGFLYFNAHPAKVFMGDTGSLALGAAFAGMAILTHTELLLVIIGGIFVMEALSVVIQVASFKLRGTRVFKMSPIHHHFELSGWSEQKVVARFWLTGCLLAIAGLAMAWPLF